MPYYLKAKIITEDMRAQSRFTCRCGEIAVCCASNFVYLVFLAPLLLCFLDLQLQLQLTGWSCNFKIPAAFHQYSQCISKDAITSHDPRYDMVCFTSISINSTLDWEDISYPTLSSINCWSWWNFPILLLTYCFRYWLGDSGHGHGRPSYLRPWTRTENVSTSSIQWYDAAAETTGANKFVSHLSTVFRPARFKLVLYPSFADMASNNQSPSSSRTCLLICRRGRYDLRQILALSFNILICLPSGFPMSPSKISWVIFYVGVSLRFHSVLH